MDINLLLERAKAKTEASSDASLCRLLGKNTSHVSLLRKRKILPSDELLVDICHLAKEDPTEWLLMLNMERTDGRAHAIYSGLLQTVVSGKEKAAKSAAE